MTTTPNPTPTSQILDAAADLIDFHGHATGSGLPGSPEQIGNTLCLEGGIMAALGMNWADDGGLGWLQLRRCPAYKAVESYLSGPVNPAGKPPFMWQDHLKFEQDAEGKILYVFVGGSEEAARAYARDRVIEVLRATALLEAAREEAATQAPADRHEVAL